MKRRDFLAACGLPAVLRFSNARSAELGKPAPRFEARDSAGRLRRSSDFAGKTIVLEWTSPSCPFAGAQYQSGAMPDLQRFARRQGGVWLTMFSSHPSRTDYLAPAQAEALQHARGAAATALLMDPDGLVGHAFGAVVTPHMFIVDGKGTLVYSGGPAEKPTMDPREVRASRSLIRAALEDLAAGRAVSVRSSPPFGCSIAYRGD